MECGTRGCPRNIENICMENAAPGCWGYTCPECGSGWVAVGTVYHYENCNMNPKLPEDMYVKK